MKAIFNIVKTLLSPVPLTEEQLLSEIKELGPEPYVKVHNASMDAGGAGIYRIDFYQNGKKVAGYTQSGVKLITSYAMAVLHARYKHYDYLEINVLASESSPL
jgi:hypothetical protein